MNIKKIDNQICSYCNQIAIAKEITGKHTRSNYYCQYHLLKEELSRTIYKIENLPGVNSSFPDYNRGDVKDYKKEKLNNKIKVDKEIALAGNTVVVLFTLGNNLQDCNISIDNNHLLSIVYKDIEYVFSWNSTLDYNKVKEYLGSDKIKLAYCKKNNKIIKYY
jgi:hypothetical protein